MSGINILVVNDCILIMGLCGGCQFGWDVIFYGCGENIIVMFMKNLDYYNKTNFGKFVILLSEWQMVVLKVLVIVLDVGEFLFYIYLVKVMVFREFFNIMYFL